MPKQVYVVWNPKRHSIEAIDGSPDEVISYAARVAGDVSRVIVDGTAQASMNLHPNAGKQAQEEKPRGWSPMANPYFAWKRCSTRDFVLPRLSIDEILRVSPLQAHKRLLPMFPDTSTWSTPIGMAESFVGQNYKTAKTDPNARLADTWLHAGQEGGIETSGLSLLPAQTFWDVDDEKTPTLQFPTVCYGSSKQCRVGCLEGTGRNNAKGAHESKYRRMAALYKDPVAFLRMVLLQFQRQINDGRIMETEQFFRLNYLSDIPWELFVPDLFHHEMFRDVQFYDYTKVEGRIPKPWEPEAVSVYKKETGVSPPYNYDLTYSYSGGNIESCKRELARGHRVAVVFLARGSKQSGMDKLPELPRRWWGHDVVSGDLSDARPCDPPNAVNARPVIVGLTYKMVAGIGLRDVNKLEGFVVILSAELVESEGERALLVAGTPIQEHFLPPRKTKHMLPLVG